MAAATTLAGCSLLLDWDLSGSGTSRVKPDDGGAPDDSNGDLLPDGAPRDGAMAGNDGSSVPEGAVPLDCGAAQLCDDFETRSNPSGPPKVGSWNGSMFAIGDASIIPVGAGTGVQSLLVDVPANASGFTKDAFLGSNGLALGTTGTVTVSVDVQLDYNPAAYVDDEYHVVLDFGPPSGETAGIYYRKRDGVYLVVQAFDGAGVRLADDPHMSIGNDLRGRFHHVDFEVVFSLSTSKGRAKVVVDKGAPTTIAAVRTLSMSVPSVYTATFGATAGAVAAKTTPAMAAHFDNIVVRSY